MARTLSQNVVVIKPRAVQLTPVCLQPLKPVPGASGENQPAPSLGSVLGRGEHALDMRAWKREHAICA
eukprot:9805294-Alexandrium_andersonii.AAC.1